MKNLVIFSGAGMSAESGLKTFRDSGGLWEEHSIYDVATPEAFERDPELVLSFYNNRRAQLGKAEPNDGHKAIAGLESHFNVNVITQNVDDLHERAGSSQILHLHGELRKVRSTNDASLISDIGYKKIDLGDLASDGGQLRPHIVWFGEAVPKMDEAISIVQGAEILVVIGTSLNVYPAAGLLDIADPLAKKYLIDPNANEIVSADGIVAINEKAATGMSRLFEILLKEV